MLLQLLKFTNFELYDWMSGVLEGVYSRLLQHAMSIAQLALLDDAACSSVCLVVITTLL